MLLVCVISKLLKNLIDFGKSLYECYVTGGHSNCVLLSFLQSVRRIWRTRKTSEVGATLAPLNIGS
jgi:hypothetical protein